MNHLNAAESALQSRRFTLFRLHRHLRVLFVLAIAVHLAVSQTPVPPTSQDQTAERRAAELVSRMTLEEKVSQMQNSAAAIPRLDIPSYDWWSEGLHGVARSGYATVFPQAIGLAATWNQQLLHNVAETISVEARAKNTEALRQGNHSIYFGLDFWSPNINIFRDPRWGRGHDDLRFFRTISTPKHFAVHSGPENTRHTVDVTASPHDLEDTYLPAFRATIVEGHADSTMCAYNSLNGAPACANTTLLRDTLRNAWGFHGYVTSDCWAITDIAVGHKFAPDLEHAAVDAVHAGTDTSCGPEFSHLVDAVKHGLIQEAEIDRAVTRLFTARIRLGLFDPPSSVPYTRIPFSEVDSQAHRLLARQVAEQSIVLLKNDGVLPLAKSIGKIAVIGPNAAALSAIEGNYNAVPSRPVVPLLGMENRFGKDRILYAQGSPYVDGAVVPVPRNVLHPSADDMQDGLKAEYFNNTSLTGTPIVTRIDPQINFDWNSAAPVPGAAMTAFSVRWTGVLAIEPAGDYTFSFTLAHCYPCNDSETVTAWIDGKQVSHESNEVKPSRESAAKPFTVHLTGNTSHSLRIEYSHQAPLFGAGITFDWRPSIAAEREEAVAVAKRADAVVAFVGLTPELEGEEMPVHIEGFDGGDRTSIALPRAQQEMLEAVAETGKPLIIVLLNGSALAVNWANDHANAVLEAWYPGEEGGTAIARTLAGDNNPAGRLPVTFYASTDQLPAFDNYSMSGRTYRYFTGKPLFGFGYGLSYSTFAYSHLRLSTSTLKAGNTLTVEAEVKNTGNRDGDEVAELYLVPPQRDGAPRLALEGYERVHLKAGESRVVHFDLQPRQLSLVDANGIRAVRAGTYSVAIGGAQPGNSQGGAASFTIVGTETLPR
jgi:beta-glucosidase